MKNKKEIKDKYAEVFTDRGDRVKVEVNSLTVNELSGIIGKMKVRYVPERHRIIDGYEKR